MSADDLFGKVPTGDDIIAKVIEDMVVQMVKAGNMPAVVLDHLGHLKHNIYNAECEYCTRSIPADVEIRRHDA